ncbi:glutaminyl-peptide cyclotransferase [Corynebacterium pygosceleis]|uniref:Glutaminyl-peptide cyclotransferase n=2 Tax=Corynebacterium pygosceleis TaxID=2800406 RepID=A0ABT3WTH6_9CORY|nr:glutaminyl-peptide cyclotransferase [Corynebacterium pygosceleis]MCK7638186.1 glutaminyl-peptide cyclotransferase [Corynebacterium pygosceleis]MCL0120719.1 glutaminyl-peptide cyclotransferase [Corynebacterium pygosceleis]MCX7444259.1 glutaminyl-peptide cyclotransferase [Corynebacterium pygosceleis]
MHDGRMPPVVSRRIRPVLSTVLAGLLLSGCVPERVPVPSDTGVDRLGVKVVAEYPMDPGSFTQGFEYDGERLLVGTGLHGDSRVYTSELGGAEIRSETLPDDLFGEGVTDTGSDIWQLTWKSGTAIRRDRETLRETGRVPYPGEGWGLCSFADTVVMSDGTDQLRLLDPRDLRERSRIGVTVEGEPLDRLNELECVEGTDGRRTVLANVWMSETIVRVDTGTGVVDALVDASGLHAPGSGDPDDTLNGIARIPGTDRLLLTGKRWGVIYEVRLTDRPDPAG